MRTDGAIDIVDAAYRLDIDDDDWLSSLTATASESFGKDAAAIFATVYQLSGSAIDCTGVAMNPVDPSLRQAIDAAQLAAPPAVMLEMRRGGGCDSLTGFLKRHGFPLDTHRQPFAEHLHQRGIRDLAWVQGFDGTTRRVWLVIALPEETTLSPRIKSSWDRVSVHVAAALRLRTSLQRRGPADPVAGAEAIFDPGGNCLHAEGLATSTTAQQRLRAAAVAVDRARVRSTSTDEALELWQGLFAGRWTVADTFDSDGRRLLVARKNDPEVAEDRRLTRRESQVVTLAAAGRSDSIIGYTLGLSPSTVQTHLRRGMRKMGVTSREQLAEVANMVAASSRRS